MISGRFSKNYGFLKPARFPRFMLLGLAFRRIGGFITLVLFSGYLNSNFRVHMHDLFKATKTLDPCDDKQNRYVVVLYKYDAKRKQIVPTRKAASTTLRGAQKLANILSEQTGIKYAKFNTPGAEYILIRYISINEDLERSVIRHHHKTRHSLKN